MGQVATCFYCKFRLWYSHLSLQQRCWCPSPYLAVHLGAGKHVILLKDPAAYAKVWTGFPSGIFDSAVHHRSNAPQTIISMEVLYCIGTAAFKYSALLLFHRIFGSVPRFTTFLWFFAFVILANNIAEIFLSIFRTFFLRWWYLFCIKFELQDVFGARGQCYSRGPSAHLISCLEWAMLTPKSE